MVDAETRVFLSYAHGNDEHESAVLRLRDLLGAGGVTPVLDRDYAGAGVQWPEWMMRQVA